MTETLLRNYYNTNSSSYQKTSTVNVTGSVTKSEALDVNVIYDCLLTVVLEHYVNISFIYSLQPCVVVWYIGSGTLH